MDAANVVSLSTRTFMYPHLSAFLASLSSNSLPMLIMNSRLLQILYDKSKPLSMSSLSLSASADPFDLYV